jgi:hypothetical protein
MKHQDFVFEKGIFDVKGMSLIKVNIQTFYMSSLRAGINVR